MRLLPVLAVVIAALAACSGGASEPTSTPPLLGGRGGGAPPFYSKPLLLTEGDYLPADFPLDSVWSEGVALAGEDAKQPVFEGNLAGIRLYSFAHAAADPSVDRKWCVVGDFVTSDYLTISYLPGGTYASGPEYAGICPDGSVSMVGREFYTKHGSFEVWLNRGEAAFGHDASAARVRAQSINGHDAVVISPVVERGFGRGWAAYATTHGVLFVDGQDLPVGELVKILGGVKCPEC